MKSDGFRIVDTSPRDEIKIEIISTSNFMSNIQINKNVLVPYFNFNCLDHEHKTPCHFINVVFVKSEKFAVSCNNTNKLSSPKLQSLVKMFTLCHYLLLESIYCKRFLNGIGDIIEDSPVTLSSLKILHKIVRPNYNYSTTNYLARQDDHTP